MKNKLRKILLIAMAMVVLVPAVSRAQIGLGGIVYDPTNYANSVLRYNQLVQQLAQLRQTYQEVVNEYKLALQMSQYLENMPARYQAMFSHWRTFTSTDLYGNTGAWMGAVNGAGAQSVSPAYQQAVIPLLAYGQANLATINPADARNLESVYASIELMDGANVSALTTVGNVRGNAQTVQQQIANIEQDSLSSDPGLNTEVSVLNKINATNVLTLRTLQDANNLRLSALEQQILQAKHQRDLDAANINFAIQMSQQITQNLASFNSDLGASLASYRLP